MNDNYLAAALAAALLVPTTTQAQAPTTQAGPQILMIYIPVSDQARSTKFYQELFGFTPGREFGNVLNIPGGASQRIVLGGGPKAGQTARFTLTLPDIDAVMTRVVAAGGKITQPTFTAADNNRPGVKLGWIADPDGNAIELIQPPAAR